MPINAGAIGIQPVGPQRPAGGVDGIQRRDDGTAGGFRPQTEISLKTAIEDLAATLGRIASQEKYGVAQLPSNIGQVVRNILQQSLSMEETLAQGIGSTIESQRFSTEQLSIFARMLAQIGALAEKGFSMELSDETKALLTQFKNLVVASEGGRAFEPVLMSKAAFELVDSKTPEQLPPALLEMLTQPAHGQSSEPAQLLRQLVDLLMPKPNAERNSAQAQQSAQVQQQARPTAAQQMLNSVYRQFDAPYAQPKQSTPVENNAIQNPPASQPTANLSAENSSAQPSQPTANQPAPLAQGEPVPAQQNFSTPNQQQAPVQNQSQPAPANIQQANAQTQSPAPVQTSTANQSAAGQSANISTSDLPTQQVQQPLGQTANQTPPVQNNAAQNSPAQIPQQQPANQQPIEQNLSTANLQQATGQTQASTPVQNQAQPIPANQSAAGQSANISTSDLPTQQVQQPLGQTANQTPPVQNNAAQNSPAQSSQQQPANQQPVAQNLSTANLQTPSVQNQPVSGQTQLSAPVQTSTANQSAAGQPANIPAGNLPTQQVQQPLGQTANLSAPNQSPPVQNNTAQNSPAQISQPQPTANQPAPANVQAPPVQNQPAAEVPRDDFTVSLPKKPQPAPVDEDFIARQRELMAQMQFAKTQLLQQPIQNTPQTTDALKNLAQFLMRNPASAETMSQRETTLLQNFVNNQQTVLPRDEARHLQNLLRLCQQNVPAVVQQAAVQHKIPDLPRLWAFMQLCDMASLPAHMSARALKRAAREVSDFSNAIRQTMGGDNTSVQNQRSFQMMLPLYLGENISSYPTYLSVYDETARDKETGAEKKETWLRICVLTDNIGAAELIFRVYEKTQLDMRFYFSQGEVAEDFKSYVASLRDFIGGTNFNIGEIRIGSIGEKMLLAQ